MKFNEKEGMYVQLRLPNFKITFIQKLCSLDYSTTNDGIVQ